MAKLHPAHHISVTARRLCLLNELVTVCFTQCGQLHPITRSLLPLLPFNTKAPYLPFLASLIRHRTEGENYRTNTIVFVHQATLISSVTFGQFRLFGERGKKLKRSTYYMTWGLGAPPLFFAILEGMSVCFYRPLGPLGSS